MDIYRVHGLTRSYFTRKVVGYLDYTDRPWRLEPGLRDHPAAEAAGWNGGIPVIVDPAGIPMWDSTEIIEHLDTRTPVERRATPADPVLRFLDHLLDDFSDEWFYRPAVGSRWSYPDNTVTGGWQIAEELATNLPVDASAVRELVVATMTASLPRLGVTPENVEAWMQEVFVSWFEVLQDHFTHHDYLFGARPSLADFAIFGANAAHLVGDPYCRELADQHGPLVVAHTNRLRVPHKHDFGAWLDSGDVPATLIAVIGEAGKHYLPWVAQATVQGSAAVEFANGTSASIATTPFLDRARGIMLARYRAARCDALDAILEEAGVLTYFVDHLDQATEIPDATTPAQPDDNRPYSVDEVT